jgi:protein-L-isoaspartate(D-aspartate) O-methyltransferase
MITFPGLPDVDRSRFIPDRIWVVRDGTFTCVSRDDDPGGWVSAVASDAAVTIALTDGMWPSSSSSAPSMMARMISALRLEPGMRVLEIGTGTGYNAACLASLGANVVTVEIDEEIADRARDSLRAAGFPGVTVLTGDGERGAPDHAPFDRVMATAAVRTVPYSWASQTREDGLIVAPYTGPGHPGGLLVLTVSQGAATGSVECDAPFMPMRGHGLSQAELRAIDTDPHLRIEITPTGQRTPRD